MSVDNLDEVESISESDEEEDEDEEKEIDAEADDVNQQGYTDPGNCCTNVQLCDLLTQSVSASCADETLKLTAATSVFLRLPFSGMNCFHRKNDWYYYSAAVF